MRKSGDSGNDNPADVGTKCVSEKDMAASVKRLGMSHDANDNIKNCSELNGLGQVEQVYMLSVGRTASAKNERTKNEE